MGDDVARRGQAIARHHYSPRPGQRQDRRRFDEIEVRCRAIPRGCLTSAFEHREERSILDVLAESEWPDRLAGTGHSPPFWT